MAGAVGGVGATLIEGALAGLSRLAMSNSGKWIASALLALGLEIGVTSALSAPFLQDVRQAWGGLPDDIIQYAGLLNVDVYVSVILSALVIRQAKQAGRAALLKAGRR